MRSKKIKRKPAAADGHDPAIRVDVVEPNAWAQRLVATMDGTVPAAMLAQLRQQAAVLVEAPTAPSRPMSPDPTKPIIVRDERGLMDVVAAIDGANAVSLDIETKGLDARKGEIAGVGLAVDGGAFYIPLGHRFEETGQLRPDQLPLGEVLSALRLQDRPLVAHNAKFEYRWLRHHGGITCFFIWDTMLAARLLHSDLKADLELVACRELDVPPWAISPADMKRIELLPIDRVASYCAKDCVHTLALYRSQLECLA